MISSLALLNTGWIMHESVLLKNKLEENVREKIHFDGVLLDRLSKIHFNCTHNTFISNSFRIKQLTNLHIICKSIE